MTAPSAATVRVSLRRVRRGHSDRTLGDLLTDVYLIGFVAVVYGGGATAAIRRHLAQPLAGPAGTAALRAWLVVGLLAVVTALAWRGLRMVGPLVTTPAVQSWVLATPMDRAGWLRPPFAGLLTTAGLVGAGIGVLAGWAGLSGGGSTGALWAGLTGTAVGVALAALAVHAQPHPARRGRVPAVAIGLGLALAALVVVCRAADVTVVDPRVAPAWSLSALAVAGGVVATRRAASALPRLDRAALGGGAQLAGAAVTAAVMLDPTLLAGILTARRWRAAGTVHSRHFAAGPRWWVLLQADLVRQVRRRTDVLAYAALALVPYAVGVFAPPAVGPVRVVAAYLAVDRLAGGLRAVARSAPLRRLLGGPDQELRNIHLVVPGLGLLVWWTATSGAGATSPPVVTGLLVAGVLAAVYRTATRPPMSYDSDIADSPFGPVPTTLLRRLVRGPDLVAVLVLLDLFTSVRVR